MPFCRRAFSLASMAWLLTLCTSVSAQQWVGDLRLVNVTPKSESESGYFLSWALIDEKENVHTVIPSVREAMMGFPEAYRGRGGSFEAHWLGDALYTLAGGGIEEDEDGTDFRRWAFAKWRDGEWHFLAGMRTGFREYFTFVPCDDERFILVSVRADMFDNERLDRSPFCRASVREGKDELHIDASIDHGQNDLRKYMTERACTEFDDEQEKYIISEHTPNCFDMAHGSQFIMTEGRATLINERTGLYWVFSTETAKLVKAGNIFKSVTPEMVAKGGFGGAVKEAYPEKSGTVLVSTQDENLMIAEKEDPYREANEILARSKASMHNSWDSADPPRNPISDDIWTLIARKHEEMEIRSPLTVWYRIFPEDGRVERLAEPPEERSAKKYYEEGDLRPTPDGSAKEGQDESDSEEQTADGRTVEPSHGD